MFTAAICGEETSRSRNPKSLSLTQQWAQCTTKPVGYLEDKLERALLRTSGVSSTEVGGGAASARLSLSDAVSPSIFASDSDSYKAKTEERRSKLRGELLRSE